MFFSKVSGTFPEIFEKSIDKHEIDAILIRRPVYGPQVCESVRGRAVLGGFHGRIRVDHPDTESGSNRRGFCVLMRMKGNGASGLRAVIGGVL